MRAAISREAAWGDGDKIAKVRGFYEQELHGATIQAARRGPDLVINVGAADGFYAAGFAQLLPNARVVAFEAYPLLEPSVPGLS